MIKRQFEIEISIDELVEEFWELDNSQQAEFFNKLGTLPNFAWQMNQAGLSGQLEPQGRLAMRTIGHAAEDHQEELT